MEIAGLHHITAVTTDLEKNRFFYAEVLGLRIVKEADESEKFIYYGDALGTPGTLIAFVEEKEALPTIFGRNQISVIGFTVPSKASLVYFGKRFNEYDISYQSITEYGREGISLCDPDGLRVHLIVAENELLRPVHQLWEESPIPLEYQILGLGPVRFSIFKKMRTDDMLVKLFGYIRKGAYEEDEKYLTVFQSGPASEIHVESRPDLSVQLIGAGAVSHIAFRTSNEASLEQWQTYLKKKKIKHSEIKDHGAFQSIYFKETHGLLIEIATATPGFGLEAN